MCLALIARWATVGVTLLFVTAPGLGQATAERSVLSVLQWQMQVLLDAWGSQVPLPVSSRIGLRVTASAAKEFTEKSMLEGLQKRGYHVFLTQENVDALLDVTVLEQSVQYEEIAASRWKRTTRVSLDGRLSLSESSEVRSLGNIQYTTIDTVSRKEDGWWNAGAGAFVESEAPGLMEKLVVPFVVIVASVVVVYLFFTVRN
jgi:hypothetical protein